MNKAWLKGLSLVFLLVLTACGGGSGGLCSAALEGQLAPTCSPVRPEPSVSPVGSWQGTLTTTTGGSGTEPFTAEVIESETGGRDYTGVFTVDDKVYNVSGFYSGASDGEEAFIFEIPLDEIQPAVSPAEFYGLTWSGAMTESTYSGGWFFNSETANRTPAGEFNLERLP